MDDFFEEQLDGPDAEASLTVAKSGSKTKSKEEEGQLTVDVYQTEDDIVIKSTIAGVTAEDLDISLTNDMVTIKGVRNPDEKVRQSDYYYRELYWGPFSRSIILPEEIDADNAKASIKNGILTIRLPKLAKSRVKKIKVMS
jgi:HSP20 family protein